MTTGPGRPEQPTPVLARRATAVVLALVGAGLGLVVAARPLATGVPGAGAVSTATRLSASGSVLAPAYPALLTVAAAGALALAFAGRRLRPVVAGLVAAAAVGAEVAWRGGLADTAAGLSRSTVPAGLPVSDVVVAPLAWGGDAAALVVLVAAVLALLFGPRWGPVSRRYEPPAGEVSPDAARGRRTDDDWEALSRGEDPTV